MEVAEPSFRSLVLDWSFDPAALLLSVAAGVAYVVGVRRLAARGRTWPMGRSVAFATGSVVVVVATCSGLARYDTVLFSLHSTQHVLLGMVAPLLFALAAPVTLALQATSRPTQTMLLRLLHRPPISTLAKPIVAWLLFGGTLFGLYFSPLFELSLRSDLVHVAVHLHFVVVGSVFCWVAVGVDPLPGRLPHGGRVLFVVLAVPFHAVLGLALVGTSELLADGAYARGAPAWLVSALADQRTGGGILWGSGEVFGLVLSGLALVRWMRHEERVGAREDRRLDAALSSASGDESG